MKPTRSSSAFTLIELLVVISIIGILATLAVPAVQNALVQGQMTGTLSNARQLHLATQNMSLDTFTAGGDGLNWTTTNNGDGTSTPVSLQVYFDALTNNNYLTQADLKKLLSAPGKTPQNNAFNAQNIAFKIFEVTDNSPSDQPFVVTANWAQSGLTNDSPYAKKGFVVFKKGGDGGIYKRVQDATSTNIFPPAGTDAGDGATYSYQTLN